jgi:short-subunit dehydrogenase
LKKVTNLNKGTGEVMNTKQQKVAIVTGATSGIGEATANLLSTLGYRVLGTSRRGAAGRVRDQFEMLTLDVTDDHSVNSLVKEVIQRAGRIDLLVNNAGFGIVGGAEESSIEQGRSIFETNVFGSMRMIKAVLPHMHSQSEGRIINISSVLGRIPAPFMALYSATKHALEGYSESMDHEIRKFNIRSILIEPAYTKTNFDQNTTIADGAIPIYDKARNGMIQLTRRAMAAADAAEVVAQTVARAATDRKPKIRYTAGSMAAKIVRMRRFVPEGLYDSGVRKTFHLDD